MGNKKYNLLFLFLFHIFSYSFVKIDKLITKFLKYSDNSLKQFFKLFKGMEAFAIGCNMMGLNNPNEENNWGTRYIYLFRK